MKKQILLGSLFAFAAAVVIIGCKKEDTTPPTITLKGSNPMSMSLNSSAQSDPGATANDSKDGDISSKITSTWSSTNPNNNIKGSYTITYSVSDAAGNQATATRTVYINNDAEAWAGTYLKANIVDKTFSDAAYTVSTGNYTWQNDLIVTTDPYVNNKIIFNRYSDYSGYTANNMVTGMVTGLSLTIPNQTATGIGTPAHDHTFQGAGLNTQQTPTFKIKIASSDYDVTLTTTVYDSLYLTK